MFLCLMEKFMLNWYYLVLKRLVEFANFYGLNRASLVAQPEKAMAPHSSTLAWKIPWTEEPGRLQYMGSLRVGHD